MDLDTTLLDLLRREPGQTTTELHAALGGARSTRPSRAKLSAHLRDMPSVVDDGAEPRRWYLAKADAPKPQPKTPELGTPPAAPEQLSAAKSTKVPKAKAGRTRKKRRTRAVDDKLSQLTKRELITLICHEIGVPDVGIGRGSTEPKKLFLHVSAALQLGLDESLSKPELAEAITRHVGLPWDSGMDSRASASGGGDTVTALGLRQVLRAVRATGSPSAPSTHPEAIGHEHPSEVQPASSYGLHPAPPEPGNSTGHGGGGEGPLHAALKALVRDRPAAAVGEQLTYLAEDLIDVPPQRLGDEIRFITGDRVDLLMQDAEGRYVVVEVEPEIGPSDHVGFHQAAKYWALVAVANNKPLEQVRRIVVARTIDKALASHYRTSYGIESIDVPMVNTEAGWVLESEHLPSPRSGGPPPPPRPVARRTLRARATSPKGTARMSKRLKKLVRAYDLTHGKPKNARSSDALKAALSELSSYSDDVLLEAIVSTARPEKLRTAAEAISLRRAQAATALRQSNARRAAASKSNRASRTTTRAAPQRTLRAKKATGAAIGEAPLYKPMPPGQRYCPSCGLLEINCHC